MKKKIQTYSQYFKMPHLFLEDLENIERIIKEELNPVEYKLDSKLFEYQEIKEIPEDTGLTNEFHIQTISPNIIIDFDKFNSRIYVGDDDIKTVGAVKKITDIISKKERKLLWYLLELSKIFAPILFYFPVLLGVLVGKEIIKSNRILFLVLTIVICVVAVFWWIMGDHIIRKKFSVIEFIYKKTKSNLFTRNKDKIMINIIVAIISILATIFFQKIFK